MVHAQGARCPRSACHYAVHYFCEKNLKLKETGAVCPHCKTPWETVTIHGTYLRNFACASMCSCEIPLWHAAQIRMMTRTTRLRGQYGGHGPMPTARGVVGVVRAPALAVHLRATQTPPHPRRRTTRPRQPGGASAHSDPSLRLIVMYHCPEAQDDHKVCHGCYTTRRSRAAAAEVASLRQLAPGIGRAVVHNQLPANSKALRHHRVSRAHGNCVRRASPRSACPCSGPGSA